MADPWPRCPQNTALAAMSRIWSGLYASALNTSGMRFCFWLIVLCAVLCTVMRKPLPECTFRFASQRILICGWGEAAFMASILRELDRGPAALPRGSEVVLFNQHDPPDQLPSVRSFLSVMCECFLCLLG